MLDIKFIRANPELVKENIRKKFKEHLLPLVDELLKIDEDYRKLLRESEDLRAKRNKVTSEINALKKSGKDASALLEEAKRIPVRINDIENENAKISLRINEILLIIPNMMHESVPIGKNDKENVVVEKIGEPKVPHYEVKNHAEVCEKLGIADFDASGRTTGKGFFFMKGGLAMLNQALIRFGIDFMIKKGYTLVEPPLMIRQEICNGVVDFNFFKDMVYKIEGEDLYLIGTSEHPLIGMFINQVIDEKDLPIKIVGYSQCFRKEIGSHGIDEKGIYRTHQFNKVEQIIICKPEDSYKYYDELLENSKGIFKALGLPTRVLECCSGDLADLKAKSCDLEAWSPRKKEYFEVCSCSNLTEAQARRLNIKVSKGGERYFPHTLNDTAIATSRALVAILENYQNADGSITVPEILRPFMHGMTVIR
jgi:seryl-tRNA synthetase